MTRPNPLWYWCYKHNTWTIRKCSHKRCNHANIEKRSENRPTDFPGPATAATDDTDA